MVSMRLFELLSYIFRYSSELKPIKLMASLAD